MSEMGSATVHKSQNQNKNKNQWTRRKAMPTEILLQMETHVRVGAVSTHRLRHAETRSKEWTSMRFLLGSIDECRDNMTNRTTCRLSRIPRRRCSTWLFLSRIHVVLYIQFDVGVCCCFSLQRADDSCMYNPTTSMHTPSYMT